MGWRSQIFRIVWGTLWDLGILVLRGFGGVLIQEVVRLAVLVWPELCLTSFWDAKPDEGKAERPCRCSSGGVDQQPSGLAEDVSLPWLEEKP